MSFVLEVDVPVVEDAPNELNKGDDVLGAVEPKLKGSADDDAGWLDGDEKKEEPDGWAPKGGMIVSGMHWI